MVPVLRDADDPDADKVRELLRVAIRTLTGVDVGLPIGNTFWSEFVELTDPDGVVRA
jgi:hypothetical protein